MKLRRIPPPLLDDDPFDVPDAPDTGLKRRSPTGPPTGAQTGPKSPLSRPQTASSEPYQNPNGRTSERRTYVVTVRPDKSGLVYRARVWAENHQEAREKCRQLVRWMQSGLKREIGMRFWLPKPPDGNLVEHWMEIDPNLVLTATIEGPFAPGEHPKLATTASSWEAANR